MHNSIHSAFLGITFLILILKLLRTVLLSNAQLPMYYAVFRIVIITIPKFFLEARAV